MHIKSVPFENHPDSLMNDWIIPLEIVEIAIKRLVCAKKSTFQNRSSPYLYSCKISMKRTKRTKPVEHTCFYIFVIIFVKIFNQKPVTTGNFKFGGKRV